MKLGRDISTDRGLQEAESLRYSSDHYCGLVYLRTGEWCLYDYLRRPIFIGALEDIPRAYCARPRYTRPPSPPPTTKAANTAALLEALRTRGVIK